MDQHSVDGYIGIHPEPFVSGQALEVVARSLEGFPVLFHRALPTEDRGRTTGAVLSPGLRDIAPSVCPKKRGRLCGSSTFSQIRVTLGTPSWKSDVFLTTRPSPFRMHAYQKIKEAVYQLIRIKRLSVKTSMRSVAAIWRASWLVPPMVSRLP